MMNPQPPVAIGSTIRVDRIEASPEVAVVTPIGRITLGQRTEQIGKIVDKLLAAGKHIIVFDLASVTTIDSTGIGQFISTYNLIRSAGSEMRMAGATDRLAKVFRATRLDTVFSFYSTVAEAIEA